MTTNDGQRTHEELLTDTRTLIGRLDLSTQVWDREVLAELVFIERLLAAPVGESEALAQAVLVSAIEQSLKLIDPYIRDGEF